MPRQSAGKPRMRGAGLASDAWRNVARRIACLRRRRIGSGFPRPRLARRGQGALQDLAGRLVPVYQDPDPDRYLANLSALQMVAGNYAAADESRRSLRDLRRRPAGGGREIIFDIYARARALESQSRISFTEAFAKAYRDVVSHLSDLDAYAANEWFRARPRSTKTHSRSCWISNALPTASDNPTAFDLFWAYLYYDAYRSFTVAIGPLTVEDDARRYEVTR
jgi:hypothetical protein